MTFPLRGKVAAKGGQMRGGTRPDLKAPSQTHKSTPALSGRGCPSYRQCSPPLIRPGFAGPPGIVVSLATGKGLYPMALRACPTGARLWAHPPSPRPRRNHRTPCTRTRLPIPPLKSNPARSATSIALWAISPATRRISPPAGRYHPPSGGYHRPQGDITRRQADITSRRAISPAVRRISPPAGRYYPPPGGYHRRVSATISRNLCAAVPVTPSARSQASNAWPSRFRPFSR